MRTGTLDLSDLPGARARPTLRTRAAPGHYPTLDYSDVVGARRTAAGVPFDSSRRVASERMRRDGRPKRESHNACQLGVFAGSLGGDSGHLVASGRHGSQPSNPNIPTYLIHGMTLDDAGAGVGPGSSPTRARAATAASDTDRKSWRDAGDCCIADAMATGTARHSRVFVASLAPGAPAPRHGLPATATNTRLLGRERAAAVQAVAALM
jgi:hypothetical protein